MRYIVFFFFLFTNPIVSQELYRLDGQVSDENGTVVFIGDVLLLKSSTKELIKYATIQEGIFSLEQIPYGKYTFRITSLGFKEYEKEVFVDKNQAFSITLMEEATRLDEVEVIGAKNPIEYQNGNLKIDVQNPYFSSIPNPMDLLSRLPNVQISADRESITILGKGIPLIYLGNQHVSIEEFNALPIGSIETIELINNPSAKYEAEGRAVILVRLKKGYNGGFQGSLQETVSLKRNFNNYVAFNSSFANKNWTVRGNLGYNQLLQWESNSFLFEIPERQVLVDYLVIIPRNVRTQFNPSLGVYHQWNDTDYISINASARLQTDNAPFFTDTYIVDRGQEEFTETETKNDNSKNYYSTTFNFNKELTDSWNFFAGLQYSGFGQTLDTQIRNNENEIGFVLNQTREQEYNINSFAFRFDLKKTFSENLKWEWGANVSLASADAFTQIGQSTQDIITQIDFEYKEDLYAAYSSFAGKLGKKINFELGVRVEHNEVDSAADNDAVAVVSRVNMNLFPKANISMSLDSTQTLNINYARNIDRPDFSRASSITVFINPFLEGAGNVNLRSTFTDEVSINYQKGNNSFYATFYQSVNPTNFTISYDREIDKAVLSLVNLEKEMGFYVGTTLPYTKGIWTSNNTLILYYNQIQDSMANLGGTKPFFYVHTNHQFKIAKDTTLAFGGFALGKRQEGIFERNGMIVLEASISKTFFKNWDCTLRLNDITRGTNFKENYAISGVVADGVYFSDLREIALSLKYRFGGGVNSKFKNKDVDGNIDRIK